MATQVLEKSIGKIVLIRLRGGKSIRGQLKGFDQHLNLVLDKAEDITNSDNIRELGLIIVRGDNVIMISPPPE
ncbi:RNA-binding protein [Candidatus Bathyarchaeota archaeon]|nr:MAG: RNA-binding protein [Candidatus Bathyarchaeota archaeon]